MSNLKVGLIRLCKTPEGWKRYPAVFGKNGRIKPGVALVNGQEKEFPVGRYQVRWYEGRKTAYKDVGDHPMEALNQMRRQSHLMIARDESKSAGVQIEEGTERVALSAELNRFVRATEDRGSTVAAQMYKAAGREFIETVGKTYADEITGDDLARFQKALRMRGCSDRTVHNRHANVLAFLRSCGIDTKTLSPHRPRYEKSLPEIYNAEQLTAFFAGLKEEKQRNTFEILLKCGLREQEAMYLEWSQLDLERAVLRVRANPRYRFKVKDCEARDVPIPERLNARLKDFRKAHPSLRLVTGTKSDRPNTKLLRTLKRLVKKMKLNCGQCAGCESKNKECARWFLHKFRATCITRWLRSGMDLRTVMRLSGHSDLESVMRYLSPADDHVVKERVNSIQWEV